MKMHLQLWLVFLEPAPWRVSMSMLLLLPLSTSAGGRHGPDAVMSPADAGRQASVGLGARPGNRARGSCTDYYLDLLFYHLKLRRFVVIELKAVPFDPAFVGQINLYLSAVDDWERGRLACRVALGGSWL